MESQIKNIYIKTFPKEKFNQGDILKDISIISAVDHTEEGYKISEVNLEYCIIANQECDLEHDFSTRIGATNSQDKHLPNILLLPAYLSESVKAGTHRGEEMKCELWTQRDLV